jgi:mono/diheme cytochrome c family protein
MWQAKFALMLVIILGFGSLLFAQDKPKPTTATSAVTPVTAGQGVFRAYCASCHGLGGKGGGPAAPELKTTPPDLTQLSKGNGGKFPSAMVSSVIRGDQVLLAHGSREMPIWGEAFRNVNRDETLAKIKVRNLTLYIESIQQK